MPNVVQDSLTYPMNWYFLGSSAMQKFLTILLISLLILITGCGTFEIRESNSNQSGGGPIVVDGQAVVQFISPRANSFVEGNIDISVAPKENILASNIKISLVRSGVVLQEMTDNNASDGFETFTDTLDTLAFTTQFGDGDVDLVAELTDEHNETHTNEITFNVNNVLQTRWQSLHQLHPDVTDQGMGEFIAVGDFNGDRKQDFAGLGRVDDYTVSVPPTPINERLYTYFGRDFTIHTNDLIKRQVPQSSDNWHTFVDGTVDTFYEPNPIASCDMDGDHVSELIIARPNKNSITIGFGPQDFSGNFSALKVISSPSTLRQDEGFGIRVYCRDLNGDGFDDVVSHTYSTIVLGDPPPYTYNYVRSWIIYGDSARNNIRGTNSLLLDRLANQATAAFADQTQAIPIGDLDGDGFEDIVARYDPHSFRIYYGPFNAGYSISSQNRSPVLSFGSSAPNFSIKTYYPLEDLDGDGRDNFAVVSREPVSVSGNTYIMGRIWVVNGSVDRAAAISNSFSFIIPDSDQYRFAAYYGFYNIIPGDFNGDGIRDFLIGAANWTLPGDGTNEFSGAAIYYKGPNYALPQNQIALVPKNWYTTSQTGGDCGYRVSAIDINNDHRDEMIVACRRLDDGTFMVAFDDK